MSVTKYETIVRDVLGQIATGVLKPGDALPSSRALAAQFEVSGGTVCSALVALKALGAVYGLQGRRVFVSKLGRSPDVAAFAEALARPPHKRAIVVADVRDRIARGELCPGDRLNTYQEMKAHYKVSLGVIRDAVLVLKTEGDVDVFESGVRVAQRAAPMPGPEPGVAAARPARRGPGTPRPGAGGRG